MKRKAVKSLIWLTALVIGLLISNYSFAQKTNSKNIEVKNEVLAEVGSEKITFEILEKAFQKNMNRKEASLVNVPKDSVLDFLNLYVNYRLKVQDALGRAFDKDPMVIDDIEQNRKILAETYLYEKKLIAPWINRMLSFRGKEYKIAVIVFSFPAVPNPDTLPTYNKARQCLELLKSVPFKQVALDSSDDPETGKNGGVVNSWITAGNVQQPIEDAIFSLKPGEYYPDLIKTKYGLFLIKLIDVQPRKLVKASHILLPIENNDTAAVEKIADEILLKIKNGADFSKLAEEYSSDKPSGDKGGGLEGYYSRSTGYEQTNRRLVPEFEEGLFKLKDGEISGKIYSLYGIHIIKRDSTKDFDAEKEEKDLKMIYKKTYFEDDKKVFRDSLEKAYKFYVNNKILGEIIAPLDSNKTNLDKDWVGLVPQDLYPGTLINILDKSISVGEFIKLLSTNTDLRGLGLNKSGMSKAIDKIVSPVIMNEATKGLEKDYPDFSSLMQEFRDGILLFKVEQIEVWDKLKFDSVLAKQYWDTTKTRYNTKPMYDINEIYVLTDSLAKDIYSQLQNGADFEDLATKQTQRKGFREKKGAWAPVSAEDNLLAKKIVELNSKEGSILEPFPYEKGFSIIRYNRFLPVRQKTFEEAISDFAPQFQDLMQKKLLKTWLDTIREKYKVRIDKAKIDKLFAKNKKK